MKLLEHLKEIRIMLSKSEHWTQKCTARDKDGKHVGFDGKHAYSWCIVGAVYKITKSGKEAADILNYLSDTIGNVSMNTFNDSETTTHSDILNMIDNAITQQRTEI